MPVYDPIRIYYTDRPPTEISNVRFDNLKILDTLVVDNKIGIGSNIPQQRLDVAGSIKIDSQIYDSANSPGANGGYLSRDENGIRWVELTPSFTEGIYIQDDGEFIPVVGAAQSFTVINFKNVNSLGFGTESVTAVPNPSNPTGIADIESRDFWGYNNFGQIFRFSPVGINTSSPSYNLDVRGTFYAENTNINGTLDVSDATTLNNTLDVLNVTTLSSTLDVSGATTLGFTLDVSSATTLNNTLDVSGATTLNNTLDVSSATTLGFTLDVSSATTLNNTLDVSSATTLNNTLDVSGATTLNNTLDVSSATTLNNTLDVSGATTLNNTLDVSSATTLGFTLDVSGATTLGFTLDVSGATTLNNTLDVSGATTLNNTLDVSGATTLSSTLDVSGATTLNNTLDVSGATTLSSTLDVSGATTLNNTLNVSGATTLNNTLNVSGATTLNNTLNVSGATTLSSTLDVFDTSIFRNKVDIQGSSNNLLQINYTGSGNAFSVNNYKFTTKQVSFVPTLGVGEVIDTYSLFNEEYETIEYTLNIVNGTNIQAQKVLVLQNFNNAYCEEYGIIFNNSPIVSVGVSIFNNTYELKLTPESGITGIVTCKFIRGCIE
jgi:hypothetical protein